MSKKNYWLRQDVEWEQTNKRHALWIKIVFDSVLRKQYSFCSISWEVCVGVCALLYIWLLIYSDCLAVFLLIRDAFSDSWCDWLEGFSIELGAFRARAKKISDLVFWIILHGLKIMKNDRENVCWLNPFWGWMIENKVDIRILHIIFTSAEKISRKKTHWEFSRNQNFFNLTYLVVDKLMNDIVKSAETHHQQDHKDLDDRQYKRGH